MKHAIDPNGSEYGLYSIIPEGFIQTAEPPSKEHIPANNWQSDPMNPTVCWRPKTPAEINAEKDGQTLSRWKDDPQNDALMLVLFETYNEAREGNGKQPITKQQFWNGVKAKVRTEKFFDF